MGKDRWGKRAAKSKVRAPEPAPTPRAAWWLPGPHLPTIYGKIFRRVAPAPAVRERWLMPDGDTLTALRVSGAPEAPRLVIFHGLEGGEHATYARGLLHEARARRWWADLVLWRTCDGQAVNAVRRSYHSGASDDADFALNTIIAADPDRPTAVCGISLGANVLLKWLGERAQQTPPSIRAAAAVSVPFDLAAASRRIESEFASIYGHYFLRSLKAKTAAKLQRFPDIADGERLRSVRTIWQFDDLVTAPVHGFASAAEYYERSSSIRFLKSIAVPTLLLNAVNDPFLPSVVLERVRAIAGDNPYLRCAFPAGGGHVGFISGATPLTATYWMEKYVLDWLERAIFS
jgi:hypothetical protein